jgi:hypothetical protein
MDANNRKPLTPREAVIEVCAHAFEQPETVADLCLAELWVLGFKVVPLDAGDERVAFDPQIHAGTPGR